MGKFSGTISLKIALLLLLSTIAISGCSSGSPDPVSATNSLENTTSTVDSTDSDAEVGTDAGNNGATGDGSDAGTGGEISPSPTTIGDASCPLLTTTGDATDIAGVYDLTDDTLDGEDIYYLEINDNGSTVLYNYEQDDIGTGENCYSISPGTGAFSAQGNNEFMFTHYTNPDENCDSVTQTVTIIRSDSELTITSVDIDDEDNDGDTTDTVDEVIPAAVGISSESFNSCE